MSSYLKVCNNKVNKNYIYTERTTDEGYSYRTITRTMFGYSWIYHEEHEDKFVNKLKYLIESCSGDDVLELCNNFYFSFSYCDIHDSDYTDYIRNINWGNILMLAFDGGNLNLINYLLSYDNNYDYSGCHLKLLYRLVAYGYCSNSLKNVRDYKLHRLYCIKYGTKIKKHVMRNYSLYILLQYKPEICSDISMRIHSYI